METKVTPALPTSGSCAGVLRSVRSWAIPNHRRRPRWTPENRPVVDGAKPASGRATPSTSVLPRSMVIEQAPLSASAAPPRGIPRYGLDKNRALPAPKRDASFGWRPLSGRVPVALQARAPAPGPTGQHVRVVQEPIEHRGNGRGIAEEL